MPGTSAPAGTHTHVPGDDIRHIDWNVTARTGEPFVKQFREERELTLLLVLDGSGSLRVGRGGRDGRTDKRLQAARLAGALAICLPCARPRRRQGGMRDSGNENGWP